MYRTFWAMALSRQDGSSADGIHLLWTAPETAGYSVNGYDIQRRLAAALPTPFCYALSVTDLQTLHESLRIDTPAGRVGVRAAACPEPSGEPPNEGQPPGERTCIDFRQMPPASGPNPLTEQGVIFEVRGPGGAPSPATRVWAMGGQVGLDLELEAEIRLPVPAPYVELTLVHFSRPASAQAFNMDGSPAGAATTTAIQGQPETLHLDGAAIDRVVIDASSDEALLLELCYLKIEDRPRDLSQRIRTYVTGPRTCLVYDLQLPAAHDFVRVKVGAPEVLVIGLRDDKAVAARQSAHPSGVQEVLLENLGVERVLLYCTQVASSLEICFDPVQSQDDEDQEWASEPLISSGIQVPARALNSALSSSADESALAGGRLLPGESLDPRALTDVTGLMNELGAYTVDAAPVWYTLRTRAQLSDPFVDLRGWAYTLAMLFDPAWRRALGFGYFDDGGKLTPGVVYDYRVTGYFRRRDVEEILFGFHTIPLGTALPGSFHLGPLLLRLYGPASVDLSPAVSATALRGTGRKGLSLSPQGPAGESLTITFPTPVVEVVLEFDPAASHNLTYETQTTNYQVVANPNSYNGQVPAAARAVLSFPESVDTLTLSGEGFLYGVRIVGSTTGSNPEEIVKRSVVVRGVRYESTSPPSPPPSLGTTNLQETITRVQPGQPPRPANVIGFHLHWLPPPAGGGTADMPWPTDAGTFPPFDVLGFHLERRRVDTNGPFADLDGASRPTLFFGSRGRRSTPQPLRLGDDLLRVYPETVRPEAPLAAFMEADDVMRSATKQVAPPGSLHQYRIFSVDALGRRSAPATGSVVRLEKRVPPPQPVGTTTAPPANTLQPPGVRARLLQKADPELAPDDKTLLGTSQNAIVLEWGWTQQERAADPNAAEFRVYWQAAPPDTIRGTLTGTPTLASGLYEIAATVDQAVVGDAMKGIYITAGNYPFKVDSHNAGTSITVRLEPSKLQPNTAPTLGSFVFHPVLNGSELRPAAWPERTSVQPVIVDENYSYIFRDRLMLDADHPRARVWVGVSAADDQAYVADELPAGHVNAGRSGNESSIAAVAVEGRYLGRPSFSVPLPLPNVPELVTAEPVAQGTAAQLDLPALLPAVTIPPGHKVLLERLGANALVAAMGATAGGQISASLPDGTTAQYTLANTADQAALLGAIRSGMPGRIENRFLMDLLVRYPAQFDPAWQVVSPAPVDFGVLADPLPGKAERYVYRIRLADPAGHTSEGTAIVPSVVRVPSLRSPAPPELDIMPSQGKALTIAARVHDAFDLRCVLLWAMVSGIDSPPDVRMLQKPQLLRLPNRRDLYPHDGIRLRLADGTLLAPTVVDATTGTLQPPDRLLSAILAPDPGYDKKVAVWAAALTRDGVPSRLAGPWLSSTGSEPLVAPLLKVIAVAGEDQATWSAPTAGVEAALERSTDAGASWSRVSPWLPPAQTAYSLPSSAGPRQYRLAVRAARGRLATGAVVSLP